jgi:hypothetical protein
MKLKTESVMLDGVLVETTQFAAMRAYGLMAKLAKVLGPAMGVLAEVNSETRMEEMGPALGMALANVSPTDAQALLLDVLAGSVAEVDGRRFDLINQNAIDEVFTGRLKTMFKALGHALKVNYSDFFDDGPQPAEKAPTS